MQRSLLGVLVVGLLWASGCGRSEPLWSPAPPAPPVQVAVPELQIVFTELADGVVGSAYSSTILSTGGRAPYRWRVSDGALPEGVGLGFTQEASLSLVGVPRGRGLYGIELEVRDGSGQVATRIFDLMVLDPPSDLRIITERLDSLTQGVESSLTVEAQGGVPPYRWRASDLPPGITVQGLGTPATTLRGIPDEPGEFEFVVTVSDDEGNFFGQYFRLLVESGLRQPRIITEGLRSGRVGRGYVATVIGEGGRPPYRWEVSQGALPRGLSLTTSDQETVAVSGVPETAGTYRFVLRLSDRQGQAIERSFAIEIVAGPPERLEIVTTSLAGATARLPYEHPIVAQGGTPPYEWSFVNGVSPQGINIEPSGTPGTRIYGVPQVPGTHVFEVDVTDSANMRARVMLTLDVVLVPPPLLLQLPNFNTLFRCRAFEQHISVQGGQPPYTWSLVSPPTGVQIQSVGGEDAAVYGYPDFSGTASFTVVVQDALGTVAQAAATLNASQSLPFTRWVGLFGRFSGGPDIYVSDICAVVPAPAIRASTGLGGIHENHVEISPDDRKLAYIGDFQTSGVEELFVVDLRGSSPGTPVRVHAPGSFGHDIHRFSFSPDGTWLAYVHNLIGDQVRISVVNVSDPTRPSAPWVVSGPSLVTSPSVDELLWSPDSRSLAYRGVYEVSGRQDLYLASVVPIAASRRISTFTRAASDVTAVIWSPDGSGIAYVADQDRVGVSDLYWAPVASPLPVAPIKVSDGGPSREVAEGLVGFSFGGDHLAFVVEDGVLDSQLYTVNLQASLPGPATLVQATGYSNLQVSGLQWSPAQDRLVLVANWVSDARHQVFMVTMGPAGPGALVRLDSGVSPQQEVQYGPGNFSWSPSGNWLGYIVAPRPAYSGPKGAYVIDLRGPIFGTYSVGPVVTGPGLDALSVQFSPGSDRLGITGHLRVPDQVELFTVGLWGAGPRPAVRVSANLVVGGNVESIVSGYAFRPDGQGLLYLADQTRDGVQEAWATSFLSPRMGLSSPMHAPLAPARRVERIIVP